MEKTLHVLKSIQGQDRKFVAIARVSIIEGITKWTNDLARKHVVNETALYLCSFIINDHNKNNLLKTWDDVS